MMYGKYSLVPTTSASVDISVLSLWFTYFAFIPTHPIYMAPPVWIRMPAWAVYYISTHVKISCIIDAPTTILYLFVFFTQAKILTFQSCLSLLVTIVNSKSTVGSKLGLIIFIIHSNFSVTEWNISALSFNDFSALLLIVSRCRAAGGATSSIIYSTTFSRT